MFELMDTYTQSAVIKVVGVGGGGGNAVEHMVVQNIEGVEFICANTDAQALKNLSARTALQLGTSITKGLGAEIEFRRDKVRLYLPNKFKKTESFSQDTRSIEVNDERPEPSPERVVDMLKDLDVEALEAANDLLRLFLSLDREDIELFKRMLDIISEEGNRGIFKQRLRALVSLVMPYSIHGATQQFE